MRRILALVVLVSVLVLLLLSSCTIPNYVVMERVIDVVSVAETGNWTKYTYVACESGALYKTKLSGIAVGSAYYFTVEEANDRIRQYTKIDE